VHQVDFSLHYYIEMHGQQNLMVALIFNRERKFVPVFEN